MGWVRARTRFTRRIISESFPRVEDVGAHHDARVCDNLHRMDEPGHDEVESALELIAGMSIEFAATRDINAALAPALSKIVAHLDAEVGSIWLLEEDEVVCQASVGPDPITGLRLASGEGIIGRAVRERCCQRVLDVSSDESFSNKADDQSGFVTRSLLCSPLMFGDEVLGAIEVVNKRGGNGCFRERDAHPLQVMASSAALAISNARMAKAQVEHERVRLDLELAGELQRSLLPGRPEGRLPIYAANQPARMVSGDFYDYVALDDGRVAFCLGDVSGKGINAALLMAKTSSLYRLLARTSDCTTTLLRVLNDELHARAVRGMFVTMAAGIYEPSTGLVRVANAGHEPGLLRDKKGGVRRIEADAPPLGILPTQEGLASLSEQTFDLEGGSLYLFSDGLTEALDEHGEQLGANGLERLIARFADRPLAARIHAVMAAVNRLSTRDDMTLLCLDPNDGVRGG